MIQANTVIAKSYSIWLCLVLFRSMKRFSQPYLNRAYLCSHTSSPPCLKLLDFIKQHKDKRLMNSFHKLGRSAQHTDMWKQRSASLSVPSKIEVSIFFPVT